MNQLSNHNNNLGIIFSNFINSVDMEIVKRLIDLDSIDETLRSNLTIEEMKEAGSFFTGQDLATKTVGFLNGEISSSSVILDPTCGAGNLLIEVSRHFKIEKNLSDTISNWGECLRGYDIHKSFIDLAKIRLIFEAISRGAIIDCTIEECIHSLSGIKVFDAMEVKGEDINNVTHIVMNPPFNYWESPRVNYWKLGKVNAAGVIFDHYLRISPEGVEISAILPDVLRSGSRYLNWRLFISEVFSGKCEIYGKFNKKTNVDVFILHGVKRKNNENVRWVLNEDQQYNKILSDYYDVLVGPLVAYRDKGEGMEHPYLHTRNAFPWKKISEISESRFFKGKVIEPPFLVIRRTSSPSEKYRLTTTIITGRRPVAVENHMIIIKPKSGLVRDCDSLMKQFKSKRINEWVNNRIRCRHLTVGVIKDIPLL